MRKNYIVMVDGKIKIFKKDEYNPWYLICRFYYRSRFYQWLCNWEETLLSIKNLKFFRRIEETPKLPTREENLKYYNSQHNPFREK